MVRRFDETELKELVELLKQDQVIAVPTDTVFGVCARMDSLKAQENLRDIKHRPATKAFPIMCSDLEQIESICQVSEVEKNIISRLMPGPLTIILTKKNDLPAYVNGGMDTIAVRIATSIELKAMIQMLGVPVFMTSANQSGEETCKNAEEIEKSCVGIAGILKGDTQFGQASTIAQYLNGSWKILREGPISLEKLVSLSS